MGNSPWKTELKGRSTAWSPLCPRSLRATQGPWLQPGSGERPERLRSLDTFVPPRDFSDRGREGSGTGKKTTDKAQPFGMKEIRAVRNPRALPATTPAADTTGNVCTRVHDRGFLFKERIKPDTERESAQCYSAGETEAARGGLHGVTPLQRYVHIQSPEPVTEALFGKRVFVNIT